MVDFDIIPVPSRNALTEMPPPAQVQAAVIDGNFARFNQFAAGYTPRSRVWRSRQIRYKDTFVSNANTFQYMGDDIWPWFYIQVPDCVGLYLSFGMGYFPTTAPNVMWAGAVCTGDGVTQPIQLETLFGYHWWAGFGGGLFIPRIYLNVGSYMQVWPVFATTFTGTGAQLTGGEINILALG